jgi:hypothetical protein
MHPDVFHLSAYENPTRRNVVELYRRVTNGVQLRCCEQAETERDYCKWCADGILTLLTDDLDLASAQLRASGFDLVRRERRGCLFLDPFGLYLWIVAVCRACDTT